MFCGTLVGKYWSSDLATSWTIQVSIPGRSRIFFSFPKFPDCIRGQLSILFSGCQGSFPGVKRLGLEADHLPPFSAKDDIEWSYRPAFSVRLHGVHTDNVTFTLPRVLGGFKLPVLHKEF